MSRFLDGFANYIKEKGYPVYAVAVIDGEGESALSLVKANPCQDCYSVAKLFTVTAVGLLADDGLLDVNERLLDVLGDEVSPALRAAADPAWETVTLDEVLRHRLALPKNFLDIDSQDANTFGRDYLAFTLTYPLTGRHGGEYVYTDAAYYLAARAAEKRAGKGLDAFLWERLFFPLGFREAAWSRCPMGHCMGATGLYIRTADMVKLGALYLAGGTWNGERILSESWIKTAFERPYELYDYGAGLTGKGGMRGQMLVLQPERGRAVAWHGCGAVNKEDLFAWIAAHKEL